MNYGKKWWKNTFKIIISTKSDGDCKNGFESTNMLTSSETLSHKCGYEKPSVLFPIVVK